MMKIVKVGDQMMIGKRISGRYKIIGNDRRGRNGKCLFGP